MRVGYADPPYPGCAHLYKAHPDFAGEVDHAELVARLQRDYDGWLLHTSSVALREIAPLIPPEARFMAWVKPFAAFKRNVPVAYAWEPVIVKPCRKPVVSGRTVMRDWVSESITMKRGLTGAKPERVCHWAFEVLGMEPTDELIDLYPGSGAVTAAWETWKDDLLRAGSPWWEKAGLEPIPHLPGGYWAKDQAPRSDADTAELRAKYELFKENNQ